MNKNGFVLAEAIVVSIFVIGMVSYIAINMLPLISKYEKVSNYDELQQIYLINDLYDDIKVRNVTPEEGIYKFSRKNVSAGDTDDVMCTKVDTSGDSIFCNEIGFKTFIYKYLNIEEIVVGNVTTVNRKNLSRSMREYYNYYLNTYKKNETGGFNDLNSNEMLVKFQDNTFASIVMK